MLDEAKFSPGPVNRRGNTFGEGFPRPTVICEIRELQTRHVDALRRRGYGSFF